MWVIEQSWEEDSEIRSCHLLTSVFSLWVYVVDGADFLLILTALSPL